MTVVIVVARPSVMIGDMVERHREGVRSICTVYFRVTSISWSCSNDSRSSISTKLESVNKSIKSDLSSRIPARVHVSY